MATILDTPQEILYVIAQYELDLLDLGALIWSCKTLNQRVGEDLPLQKLFLDNTNVMLRGPSGTAIRRKYVETKTAYGVKNNDPDGVLMSFPKLTPKEILKVLKVANNRISREMNRQMLVDEIFKADADKVLDFIIKSLIENSTPEEKESSIVELLSLFLGFYLNISKSLNAEDKNYVNNIQKKTVMAVLLKHIHEQQTIILANLIETSVYGQWSNSNATTLEVLESLFKLFVTFPQFKFDVNAPLHSESHRNFVSGYLIHPLEFCVAINASGMYTLLVKNGSKFDKEAPYLPLALMNNRLQRSTIVDEMQYYKCDINKRLPMYLGLNRPTTILGHTLKIFMDSPQRMQLIDHCFIEYLLNNDAKLSKEEEEEFLKLNTTQWAYKAATISRLPNGYSTMPRRVKLDFGNRVSITFKHPREGLSLQLFKAGNFEVSQYGTYMGNWIEGNQKGSVICRSVTKRHYVSWGSWGGTEEVIKDAQVFKFYMVLMYDDTIAVILENVSQNSYENFWRAESQ